MYGPPTVFGDLNQSVIANAQWSAGSGVPGPSTVFLVFEIITWVVFWVYRQAGQELLFSLGNISLGPL